jgi:hypothetical protein
MGLAVTSPVSYGDDYRSDPGSQCNSCLRASSKRNGSHGSCCIFESMWWWRRRPPNRRCNCLISPVNQFLCRRSCPQSCPQNLHARHAENPLSGAVAHQQDSDSKPFQAKRHIPGSVTPRSVSIWRTRGGNPAKRQYERSAAGPDGSSPQKKRSASCSKGCEAKRASRSCAEEKTSRRTCTTDGARISSRQARSSWSAIGFRKSRATKSKTCEARTANRQVGVGVAC